MPVFSDISQQRLETCHPDLQKVAVRAIELFDFSVLHGHRGKELQNKLYEQGASTLRWPESKHNKKPAEAIDIAPYPIDWGDNPDDPKHAIAIGRFYYLAGVMEAVSTHLGVTLRWGGDWDDDNDFFDQEFNDLVHFELQDTT